MDFFIAPGQNSTLCFQVPNLVDETFILVLNASDASITIGNDVAAVTIECT